MSWPEELLSEAQILIARGDIAGARIRLAKLTKDSQNVPPRIRCIAFLSWGNVLQDMGKHEEAERYLREAARLAAPKDTHLRFSTLKSLGDVLFFRGKCEEAERYLRRAADVDRYAANMRRLDMMFLSYEFYTRWEREAAERGIWVHADAERLALTGDTSPRQAGETLLLQGRYEEAELWLRKQADAERLSIRGLHPALESLKVVLGIQGKHEEAERCNQEMLNARHFATGTQTHILLALGNVILTRGKYEEAERFIRESLKLGEKAERNLRESRKVAENHVRPSEGISLLSLGNALRLQGKHEEAERFLRESLKQNLPPSALCHVFWFLSDVHRAQGKHETAKSYLHALENAERLVTQDRCLSLVRQSEKLHTQRKYPEAERCLGRAIELATNLDADTLAKTLTSVATILVPRQKYEEAESYLRRAVELVETLDAETRCVPLAALGSLLLMQLKYEEAESYLRRAVELVGTLDAETRCVPLVALGNALNLQGKYEEAERYLRQAVELMEACEPEVLGKTEALARSIGIVAGLDDDLDAETRCIPLVSLGDALKHQGKYEEAERWLREGVKRAESFDSFTRCNAIRSLAHFWHMTGDFIQALEGFRQCRELLFETLSCSGASLKHVPDIMTLYADIFSQGIRLAEMIGDPVVAKCADLPELIRFWDGWHCVRERVELQRHLSRPRRILRADGAALKWTPGPFNWEALFHTHSQARPSTSALRALNTVEVIESIEDTAEESSADVADADKIGAGKLITKKELLGLLPDQQSVILGFHIDKDDLIALPIRRSSDGRDIELVREDHGGKLSLFRVTGARTQLRDIAERMGGAIPFVKKRGLVGATPEALSAGRIDLRKDLSDLHRVMEWDRLTALLCRNGEQLESLHLTVIPDADMFQLPLHAVFDAGRGQYLYESVGSIGYGLSLRTLALQKEIDDADSSTRSVMRATVFAYPGEHRDPPRAHASKLHKDIPKKRRTRFHSVVERQIRGLKSRPKRSAYSSSRQASSSDESVLALLRCRGCRMNLDRQFLKTAF